MNKKAKILGLVLSSAVAMSSLQYVSASDIEGHWAQDIIKEMQAKGVISGYENGNFKPDAKLTRAEFIKIINRAFHLTGSSNQKFIDVKENDWFANEVAIAFSNGYLKGFPDGSFKPHAVITRAEVAVIMARILKIEEDAMSAEKFTDSADIPSWAKGSVGALSKAGYFKGYPDGSFGAKKEMTRSESLASIKSASHDYVTKQEELKKQEEKKAEEAKKAEEKKKEQEKKKEEQKKKNSQSKVIERSGNSGNSSHSGGSSSNDSGSGNSGGSNDSGNKPSPQPQPPAPNQPPAPPVVEKKKVTSISFNSPASEIPTNNGTVEVSVVYSPSDANESEKGVIWTVTEGQDFVKIKEENNSITFTALDNGRVEFIATLKSNKSIFTQGSIEIKGQTVELKGDIGIAYDKTIKGLTQNKVYILKEIIDDNNVIYYSINADGSILNSFENEKDAELYSLTLSTTVISGLSNTSTYQVIEVKKTDNHLKERVQEYLKIESTTPPANELTLKNMYDIQALGESLVVDLQKKIDELNDKLQELSRGVPEADTQNKIAQLQQEIKTWTDLKTSVEEHKTNTINLKITQLEQKLRKEIESAEEQIDKIVKGIEVDEAEEVISELKGLRDSLSESSWALVGKNKPNISAAEYVGRIDKLEQDLSKHDLLNDEELTLGEYGEVTWAVDNVSASWKLLKKKETADEWDKVKSGDNVFVNTVPNQIQEMRKSGVGEYKVEVTAKFDYLEDFKKESNVQEVKILENNLGTLTLTRNFEKHTAPQQPQTSKIRFNLQEGVLEWDAIENATSYDIKAEITALSTEGVMGGEYLKYSTAAQTSENIENEFESEMLKRDNKWFDGTKVNSIRVFIATNLKESKVNLNKFLLMSTSEGTGYTPSEIYEKAAADVFITAWIIPRNQNSLYITDYERYLTERTESGSNSRKIANFALREISFSEIIKGFGLPQ